MRTQNIYTVWTNQSPRPVGEKIIPTSRTDCFIFPCSAVIDGIVKAAAPAAAAAPKGAPAAAAAAAAAASSV